MKDYLKDITIDFKYNIIDMHNIDCEEFIKLDNPDALVLSILCDFKGKDELDVLIFLTRRLEELTKDDEHKLGKYMLIMDQLSSNRNLQNKLKEAEDMLRDMKLEELPSYQLVMERGEARGIETGMQRGELKGAIIMVDKFGLSVEDVSKEFNIPIKTLLQNINKK